MNDKKLRAIFERASHPSTPEEERRTSAVMFVEELARRGTPLGGGASAELEWEVHRLRSEVCRLTDELERRQARRQRSETVGRIHTEKMAQALKTNCYLEVYEARKTAKTRYLQTRLVPKQPPSALDRVKQAIAKLAEEGNDAPSDREVARVAEVSPTTVGKLRRKLGSSPSVRRGRDGKMRRTSNGEQT